MTTELANEGHRPGPPARFPHAAVWLDHFHAVIVLVSLEHHRTARIDSEREDTHLHRKAHVIGTGRASADHVFFERVASELEANGSGVLVLGPSTAKHDFRRWLTAHHPQLAARILAVESLDHPTEGELVAHVRHEFRRLDQLGLA